MSYDMIDRFLRNNLDDDDYKEYSVALDELCTPKRTWVDLTDEETETLIHRFDGDPHTLLDEVNARLKEKNT